MIPHRTIVSLYWGEPRHLALIIIFRDESKEDIEAFLTILKRKVSEHKISDVKVLDDIVHDLAFISNARFDTWTGETVFMNEVLP